MTEFAGLAVVTAVKRIGDAETMLFGRLPDQRGEEGVAIGARVARLIDANRIEDIGVAVKIDP